jgi:hypothetical protein
LWEWGKNETKEAKEYCWAITQVEGLSRCSHSSYSVREFGFQVDSSARARVCVRARACVHVLNSDLRRTFRNITTTLSRRVSMHEKINEFQVSYKVYKITTTTKISKQSHTNWQHNAAFISLEKLLDVTVYVALTTGEVIEKRREYS